MKHVNYKQVHVRVRPAHGRWVVEVKIGAAEWHPVALRETELAAREIYRQVAETLRTVQDAPPVNEADLDQVTR